MRNESQLNLGPVEVQTLDQPRTTASPQSGPAVDLDGTTGLSLMLVAQKDAGAADKEMHLSFGINDPSYWSKVKGGTKPAPRIDQLLEIPEPVQRAFVKRWARMLKMHVSDEDARKRAITDLARAAVEALEHIA